VVSIQNPGDVSFKITFDTCTFDDSNSSLQVSTFGADNITIYNCYFLDNFQAEFYVCQANLTLISTYFDDNGMLILSNFTDTFLCPYICPTVMITSSSFGDHSGIVSNFALMEISATTFNGYDSLGIQIVNQNQLLDGTLILNNVVFTNFQGNCALNLTNTDLQLGTFCVEVMNSSNIASFYSSTSNPVAIFNNINLTLTSSTLSGTVSCNNSNIYVQSGGSFSPNKDTCESCQIFGIGDACELQEYKLVIIIVCSVVGGVIVVAIIGIIVYRSYRKKRQYKEF